MKSAVRFNKKKETPKRYRQHDSESKNKKINYHRIVSAFSVFLTVLLVPVLIINLILTVKGYINPQEVPSLMGYSPLFVTSGSMEPNISVGDLIFIKKCDPNKLRGRKEGETFGDIISFQLDEKTVVTHSIIAIQKDEQGNRVFTTQGIANNMPDKKLVTADQVVGTYSGRIGKLGYVANFMMSSTGIVVCIGLPLLLFIIYEVLNRRKSEANAEKNNAQLLAELEALRASKNNIPVTENKPQSA